MNHEKIKPSEELAQLLQAEKKRGKIIVFTNGCFDLIHVGHIRLLREAKKRGDLLVVALNTDDSVRRLKGSGRPVLREAERLRIVAALDMVDYVTTFGEDTPAQIIERLQPQVLIKGGDYAVEEIVGRETVWHTGGEVIPLPLVEGFSTTELIRKISGET